MDKVMPPNMWRTHRDPWISSHGENNVQMFTERHRVSSAFLFLVTGVGTPWYITEHSPCVRSLAEGAGATGEAGAPGAPGT